jgi:Pyruvate/2-oxoacid:ferredoxin oxidoreductase delta subunit
VTQIGVISKLPSIYAKDAASVPLHVLRQGYFSISYVGSGCTGCGVCFYVCPEPGAITVFVRKDKEKASKKSVA